MEMLAVEFILPQMEFHRWDEDNEAAEYTYFRRECNSSDITASEPSELVFTDEMSPSDALDLFNTHGSIIFPNVISPETAAELREFILEENLRNENMVYVFNSENRWSFEIQIDHHPSVAKAAKEILSNRRMVAAIEKVVGKNPAVTEFTAITAAPGAVSQIYHTDSKPGANRYSRSFFPSFSFFTPLQNTTRAMGATDICPGTHMCSDAFCNACDDHGVSTAGKHDNWPVGWAALTSQQTFHRGAAHTDSSAPHRVMFYFTFAPRPRFGPAQTETRTFARGGTYGAYWQQWGHTLRDYAEPAKYMMSLPWRLLRTWGLYKPAGTQWGWDYITLMTCSVPTNMWKFDMDWFEKMMNSGGLPFLPPFLQAKIDPESFDYDAEALWIAFLKETLVVFRRAALRSYGSVLTLYSVVIVRSILKQSKYKHSKAASWIVWASLLHGVVLYLSWQYYDCVSKTSWARNLKAERLFELPRSKHLAPDLPGTNPTINDILILDDMRSDYLASLSTVLDTFQPGNKAFGHIIDDHCDGFKNLTSSLQEQLCSSILRWNRQQGRRVLVKNNQFNWAVAESWRALWLCHKEMMKRSNAFTREAIMQVDYLIAETKFGYWRETRMHQSHVPSFLVQLQGRLMNWPFSDQQISRVLLPLNGSASRRMEKGFAVPTRFVQIPMPRNWTAHRASRILTLSQEPKVGPPSPEAWLEEGDEVEASTDSSLTGTIKCACYQWKAFFSND